jgi:predicted ATP-grasp superfamily ATP-dependent carboligase
MKILIVGISTRALAQSAVAAGYEVISLDYFGDRDQPIEARVFSLWRDYGMPLTLKNLATAAGILIDQADGVVIGAGLENEPAFFELAEKKAWLSNSQTAVLKARDFRIIREILQGGCMKLPKTIIQGEELPGEGKWLVKDLHRSGGRGTSFWRKGRRLNQNSILQEYLDGTLASATFVSNGQDSVLLGMTYQYAGEQALNAERFTWCGNVAPLLDKKLQDVIQKAVEVIANDMGLIGINGFDFILHDGEPYLIEINPRFCGSLELFEDLLRINAFSLHVDACGGVLPKTTGTFPKNQCFGKAILYARRAIWLGSTDRWVANKIADIPHSNEKIPRGAPICTLLTKAIGAEECWRALLARAEALQATFTQ